VNQPDELRFYQADCTNVKIHTDEVKQRRLYGIIYS